MKTNRILYFILLSFIVFVCNAQTPTIKDCEGAIRIDSLIKINNGPGAGIGNFNEITPYTSSTCLVYGEKNNVWYKVYFTTNGLFSFTIKPYTPSADYDWAVFNLTTANCEDIFNNSTLEVSCNSSPETITYDNGCATQNTLQQGWTGPNGNIQNGCNSQYRQKIEVFANQRYFININNFSNGDSGFILDLTGTTATIGLECDLNIVTNYTKHDCGNGGEISITTTNGTPPFTYLWSNGLTTQSISNLSSGIYSVTVTDYNACSKTKSFSISQYPTLSFNISSTNLNCYNDYSGQASVNNLTGTPPFQYQWNTNPIQTTQSINSLLPGTYNVTVTDINGCQLIKNTTITQPSQIIVTTTLDSNYIATFVSGGVPPYNYLWSNGAITQNIYVNLPVTYYLTITDAANCKAYDTVVVMWNSPLCNENILINSIPYSNTNTTCGSSNNFSSSNNSCNSLNIGGEDKLYKYIPDDNQFITINLNSTISNISLLVTQNCPDYGNCIISKFSSSQTSISTGQILLMKDKEYYILVSSNSGCINSYTLNITKQAASCFDGIQNQGEAGIDCGGPCVECVSYSPVISPDIIASGGGYYSNPYSSISLTIGEPIIETISNSNASMTQGFQQGDYNITSIEKINNNDLNIEVNVYPNPTSNFINIKIKADKQTNLSYLLVDISGRTLAINEFSSDLNQIDFSKYAIGSYFLKVYDNEGFSQTFKIEKLTK